MNKYVPRNEVLSALKIHRNTLLNMASRGDIEYIMIGNKHYYNLNKYLFSNKIPSGKWINICYCRVSSRKQKGDLVRQIEYMKTRYPTYKMIYDIGSGLNFNRKGLNKIIDIAVNGELNELVVAYKDRLARFGYELIENIITKYSNGKIVIVESSEEETPNEELVKDVLSIMNVYVAKINGLRKYKTLIKSEIQRHKKGKYAD